jgi:hypothetical protein
MTIVTQHLLTEDKFHEAEEVEMLANWPTEDMILICFFFLTLFRFDMDMPKPKVSRHDPYLFLFPHTLSI